MSVCVSKEKCTFCFSPRELEFQLGEKDSDFLELISGRCCCCFVQSRKKPFFAAKSDTLFSSSCCPLTTSSLPTWTSSSSSCISLHFVFFSLDFFFLSFPLFFPCLEIPRKSSSNNIGEGKKTRPTSKGKKVHRRRCLSLRLRDIEPRKTIFGRRKRPAHWSHDKTTLLSFVPLNFIHTQPRLHTHTLVHLVIYSYINARDTCESVCVCV